MDMFYVRMTLNWSLLWIQPTTSSRFLKDSIGSKSQYSPTNFGIFNLPKTNSKNYTTKTPTTTCFFLVFPSFTHTFSDFLSTKKKKACFHLEIFLRLVRPYYRGALDGRHIFALATRPFPSQWQFFRRHWAKAVRALKINKYCTPWPQVEVLMII